LPWFMAVIQKLSEKFSRRLIGIAAILLSQQFFAGFPQATFLTLLFAGSWALFDRILIPFILVVFLGIGISAIQILPSWEFIKEAGISGGLSPGMASYFSFPLVHLLSFFNPFAVGNPKFGTYPPFSEFDGSIFWENTGYVGLLPLTLLLIPLRYRNKRTVFFFAVLLMSFLFMWGSHSPLYFIYSIWPFNLFRVPSRFLWIFVFALLTLSSLAIQKIFDLKVKRTLIGLTLVLILINTGQLFFLWKPYHLIENADLWVKKPELATLISKTSRMLTLGAESAHNAFFLKSGWKEENPYLSLRSTLAPDSNIIWDISQHEAYAGRSLRRPGFVDSLLLSHMHINENEASGSAMFQKLIDLLGITHVVSTLPLTFDTNLQKPLIFDQQINGTGDYVRLYVNPTALPRAYFATDTISVRTVESAISALTKDSFDPKKSVLVEKDLSVPYGEGGSVNVESSKSNELIVTTQSETPGVLVTLDTFYPGWHAYIDGRSEVEIFPVNIRFRGVVVPKGSHTVTFIYSPNSVRVGAAVSLMAFLVLVVLFRTEKKVLRPAPVLRRRGKPRTRRG
ncbi:MAG: hypothetical protein ACD_36C00173G0002, partial [uncultured bacterium]